MPGNLNDEVLRLPFPGAYNDKMIAYFGRPTADLVLSGFKSRVGFLGNSLTLGNGSATPTVTGSGINTQIGESPATFAQLLSTGGWELTFNAGVAGETSAQIAARVATDIVAKGCTVCVLHELFWNDVGGVTTTVSMANLATIVAALRAANIIPVIGSMTPDGVTGGTTARKLFAATMNRKLLKYANENGYAFVDCHTPIVDPLTGAVKAAYIAADNSVHMVAAGYQALGLLFAQTLDRICPSVGSILVNNIADPTDLLAGLGLFSGAPTAGVAGGWTNSLTAGGVATIITDAAVNGSTQRLTATAAAADGNIAVNMTTGFAVGDVLEFSGIVTSNGGVATTVLLADGGFTSIVRAAYVKGAITRGKFRQRYTVPVGATNVAIFLYLRAGTGVVEYSQIGIRNLTTLGVL